MTTKTPREVIAKAWRTWTISSDTRTPDEIILSALAAAGYSIHDTKTHVAVPREPTEAMLARGGEADDTYP